MTTHGKTMEGRVAIRKYAQFLTPLIGAASRMLGGKAVKEGAKAAVGSTFIDKVKGSAAEQAGKNLANAPKNLANSAGEKVAEQNRQAQASMEQRGQQMAEKAKQGSQITTGDPMDMSWQMLKAWSWAGGFEGLDKK